MKSLSPRRGNLGVERPPRCRLEFNGARRPQRLRRCELKILYSPGADIFTQCRHLQLLAELSLQAGIGRGSEKFTNQGIKLQVADIIARNQRRLSPRTPDNELQFRAIVFGTQVALGEWSCLMEGQPANGKPIPKRAGIQIQKLAKQVLIHGKRGLTIQTVAPPRVLHPRVEVDECAAQMQRGRNS